MENVLKREALVELNINVEVPLGRKVMLPVKSALERLLCLGKLSEIYGEVIAKEPRGRFFENLLHCLDISYELSTADLSKIPLAGPLVVVANHPFRLLDGLILVSAVKSVRADFKMLANSSLNRVPELCDTLIPIDPFGKSDSVRANTRPIREAIKWLQNDGVLGVFPAGEVAHFDLGKLRISDSTWSPSIARIIRKTRANVLPIFFHGSNSLLFQIAGLFHSRLRTALLPREFLNQRGKRVDVKIGSLLSFERLEAFKKDETMVDYLRRRACLLKKPPLPAQASRGTSILDRRKSPSKRIIAGFPASAIAQEINSLPLKQTLLASDSHLVLFAQASQIPKTIVEIGRLREITFRDAGEGTQNEIDLDEFDSHYVHLFVWSRDTQEVVGAYRVGKVDEILSRFGKRGLYTHTLFDYENCLLDRINPALELGRSFVRPEYQKTFLPLFLLWKGIAQYVAQHPQYRILFGPVSISNRYQPISRQFIADCLSSGHYKHELAHLVRARTPLRKSTLMGRAFSAGAPLPADIQEISAMISDIEADRKGLPTLLKQYLKLGGKLLAFNVDRGFSDVLDGLILVDLVRTDLSILIRLMGEDPAERFLAFHNHRYLLAG